MTDKRYISTKDAAEMLGLTTRRVVGLCNDGKFEGVVRKERSWNIPEESLYSYQGVAETKTR